MDTVVEVKNLAQRYDDVEPTLRQIFEAMLTQAFDGLETKGWETAIRHKITEEEGGEYGVGFAALGWTAIGKTATYQPFELPCSLFLTKQKISASLVPFLPSASLYIVERQERGDHELLKT